MYFLTFLDTIDPNEPEDIDAKIAFLRNKIRILERKASESETRSRIRKR